MNDRVKLHVEAGVADVRLNRPDKMNALDRVQFDAINLVIARIAGMRDVRCVVLSGEGAGFCAGIDIALLAGGEPIDLMPRTHGEANWVQQIAWGWRMLPMPVIAAVHGVAYGAGFQMMMGADMRYATPDAKLSVMEVRWGLVPDVAGIALFRGVVRDDVARDISYTGRLFDGAEAAEMGVVTRVADDPLAQAMATARMIAANSPAAIGADKRLFNLALEANAAEILLAESREQLLLLAGPDHAETLRAAREKRAPLFAD